MECETPLESLASAKSSLLTLQSSLHQDIYQALSLLKEDERTCITLQLIDGYAIDEIADITKMPTGTVKSHLKRGKDKMANYLRQNGYDRR
jgi:RNA polymerase sigma-70 factor (ECF subfamily)